MSHPNGNDEVVLRQLRLSDQADDHLRQITTQRGNLINACMAVLSTVDLLTVELVTARMDNATTVRLPKRLDQKLTNAARTRGCSKTSLINGAILAFDVVSLMPHPGGKVLWEEK
jgi:hypothetical protein